MMILFLFFSFFFFLSVSEAHGVVIRIDSGMRCLTIVACQQLCVPQRSQEEHPLQTEPGSLLFNRDVLCAYTLDRLESCSLDFGPYKAFTRESEAH